MPVLPRVLHRRDRHEAIARQAEDELPRVGVIGYRDRDVDDAGERTAAGETATPPMRSKPR
jgi:hypothetical protein